MNYGDFPQSNVFTAVGQEIRGAISIPVWKSPVLCPKPQRIGLLIDNPMRPFLCNLSPKSDVSDSKAGADLLDIIFEKEGLQSASQLSPLSASSSVLSPSGMSSLSSSSCRGGCVRMKFGPKPAAIRVEGFECLNRDRQHSTVPAVAW
ncbi:hypothetical protein U1Q18_002894 [Sarracenia purpurea var. burkii]